MTRRSASAPTERPARREVLRGDLDRLSGHRHLYYRAEDADDTAQDALREGVRGAVETALTARQRAVVELYFFEGLSQGQIAAHLGVTQQVVHKSLHGTVRSGRLIGGALSRLRVALEPLWRQQQAPRGQVG